MTFTRRDVSWAVMLRLARTGIWMEWSKGHRSTQEVVSAGELPARLVSVAEVRFERTTVQRDVFDLSEIAEATGALVPQNPLADRLARIAQAHTKDQSAGGTTSGSCTECDHAWPCPTWTWAISDRDPLATWDPADDEASNS